jgi:phytoene synthase
VQSEIEKSYRYCEQIARGSGSNFYLAFQTLPRTMFREMCVLYAFMRQTDDLGDNTSLSIAERQTNLDCWRDELSSALRGEYAASRCLPALSDVVLKRSIPQVYLYEVIRGVQGDLSPRRFRTKAELELYCFQVAGAVGLCCLRIWGFRGHEPRDAAIACGNAFQLTNILRDLQEDSAAGRVYLPAEDLARFGYSEESLRAGTRSSAFHQLMKFEVKQAWNYYDQALPLRNVLSPPGQRIFLAFMDLYSSLLTQIEKADYDVFTSRIRLSRWKKLSVGLRCLFRWRASGLFPRHPRSSAIPPVGGSGRAETLLSPEDGSLIP